jgi:hypothetical protein
VYVWGVGRIASLALRPSVIYCTSLWINPLLIPHFEWNVGLYLWRRHNGHLVPWRTGPGDKILNGAIASQLHRTCVWQSHLPLGTFHKWDCPSVPIWKGVLLDDSVLWIVQLSSLIDLCLVSVDPMILCSQGPDISPFACLSQIVDSYCFEWFLFDQYLTTLLATLIEMPQAGSGPVNGCSDPVLTSQSAVSLPAIPSWLAPIRVTAMLVYVIWIFVWLKYSAKCTVHSAPRKC